LAEVNIASNRRTQNANLQDLANVIKKLANNKILTFLGADGGGILGEEGDYHKSLELVAARLNKDQKMQFYLDNIISPGVTHEAGKPKRILIEDFVRELLAVKDGGYFKLSLSPDAVDEMLRVLVRKAYWMSLKDHVKGLCNKVFFWR